MDKLSKWRLESFCKDLEKTDEYGAVAFSPDELEANIDAWNQFFAEKGLSDPTTVKAVEAIINIIGRNIIYRSKDDQFYAHSYLERKADNPPLQKAQLRKKVEGTECELWTGQYIANLTDPEQWPGCIRDYTSCNAIEHGISLLEYGGPAKLGLTYYKLSNFQIEAAKIAIEVIEYFKKLYGQDLPKQEEDK